MQLLPNDYLIYENEHFVVEHSYSCAIPGYLILTTKELIRSIAMLSPAAAASLGPTLALITKAVESIIKPEIVYCARFGEDAPQLHFHIFPRTKAMAIEYGKFSIRNGPISGPCLFDWAREHYQIHNASRNQVSFIFRSIQLFRKQINEQHDILD